VRTLAPGPGERFLDLACGTGAVALLAAKARADVVGLDISPGQLAKARDAAAEAGLDIRFDEGDAQELPYGDGAFDVVASAFGVIFARATSAQPPSWHGSCAPADGSR
jgi:ubiquinone/menaquinone biosynthesis C-methylase UbiE